MRAFNKIIKSILLVLIPVLLISCSSSSYYERYGSKSSTKKTHAKKVDNYEDESSSEMIIAADDESETIFNKLSQAVGNNSKKKRFLKELVSFLNTPYKYGGNSRNGIDCSAFTQKVYANSLNISIPRTAREQFREWKIFKNIDELRFGDLIYFNTSKKYFPGHVGIYLDNKMFAHASSSKGVIISSLTTGYYSNRFVGANRIKIKK